MPKRPANCTPARRRRSASATWRHAAATLLLGCGTTSVAAAGEGLYLGASAGYSSVDGVAHTPWWAMPTVGVTPTEVPLNGVHVDGSDAGGAIHAGYGFARWLGAEVEYARPGRFESRDLYPPSDRAELTPHVWSLRARAHYQLGSGFSALWLAGVARTRFAVAGRRSYYMLAPPGSPPPPPWLALTPAVPAGTAPWVTPPSSTGLTWGAGFAWAVAPHWSVGLEYRQYRSAVLNVETTNLTVTWAAAPRDR